MARTFLQSLIVRLMGPTWGPSGADRTQVGPVLAPWTLLSGIFWTYEFIHNMDLFYGSLELRYYPESDSERDNELQLIECDHGYTGCIFCRWHYTEVPRLLMMITVNDVGTSWNWTLSLLLQSGSRHWHFTLKGAMGWWKWNSTLEKVIARTAAHSLNKFRSSDTYLYQ